MNETNQLLQIKSENEITIYKNKSSKNESPKKLLNKIIKDRVIIYFILLIIIFIIISIIIYFYLNKRNNNHDSSFYKNINQEASANNDINQEEPFNNGIDQEQLDSPLNQDDNFIPQNELIIRKKVSCDKLDPLNMFDLRIKKGPIVICKNKESKHICYQNNEGIFNDAIWHKNGAICTMENIILDPSKAEKTEFIYKGPVDSEKQGFPILSNGFFNMKCKNPKDLEYINTIYDTYFNSWNYDYKIKKGEKIEELAPNQTVLFLSRNQDSPNLFHGNSEIINVISIMYLFKLKPENIQVIFLESITIKDDPFYDIYKNMISRGGKPIYIKDLKKKYHISSAIHIPINWDSPCFIENGRFFLPNCKHPTKTYKLYNDLVDKYLNIPNFKDSFISDKKIFYYPKSIIKNHKLKTIFNKTVTIQWRKVWPKGRKGQSRILGNGPQLADKLSSILPKNILIRLVDTANLPMNEQISIMRKTDYFIGIHGAGLSLSIFMPNKSIFHEIVPNPNLELLQIMSALSGHKTYSDIINAEVKTIDDSENIFFNVEDFAQSVLNHMNKNHFL